jgi:uncharacterized protein YjbJ (UPF0337 family)
MDKDRIKGKIEQVKGEVKERVGGATKDRSTQAEGILEKKKGEIREGYGEAKDEMRKERERTDPDRDL